MTVENQRQFGWGVGRFSRVAFCLSTAKSGGDKKSIPKCRPGRRSLIEFDVQFVLVGTR